MERLRAGYEGKEVLHDLWFNVEQGEVLALLGPSGCGKTTLLRCLAGLEPMEGGRVHLEGQNITELAPERRHLGLVFQQPALFPHMDVGRNGAYGLEVASANEQTLGERLTSLGRWLCRAVMTILPHRRCRLPERDHVGRVRELLKTVGLTGYEKRKVDTLSGGEAQRVALARALAPEPRVLLLDEPLSSLDRVLRESLRRELRAILKAVGVTAIYVTHDQGEAAAVADRVALMRDGRIVQMDTPARLYQAPADAWVARFLGLENLIPVKVHSQSSHDDDYIKVQTTLKGAEQLLLPPPDRLANGHWHGSWELLLPPGAIGMGQPPEGQGAVRLEGSVADLEVRPEGARVWVEVEGEKGVQRFVVTVVREEDEVGKMPKVGDIVGLWILPERARLVKGDE